MTEPEAKQPSARELLLDTAERLIAEQGPSVPLRQVVLAAGQRNNAAVRYHFGSREQLIAAVIDSRQVNLERERLVLLAAAERRGELGARAMVEALLRPVFAMQRTVQPSYHSRFMEMVRGLPEVAILGRNDWPATSLIVNRIAQTFGDLPSRSRDQRVRAVITAVFALLADLERTNFVNSDERDEAEATVIDLVLALVGHRPFDAPSDPK